MTSDDIRLLMVAVVAGILSLLLSILAVGLAMSVYLR